MASLTEVVRPPAANAFAALLGEVQVEIDKRLRRLFLAKLAQARVHGRPLVELVTALRDLCLRGGKRIRPALVMVGQAATGGDEDSEAGLSVGLCLELLQAYLLIHDDWMDGDLLRRGGPAVHAQLSRRFHSTHLGERAGVLAGDYASALALEVLANAQVRTDQLPKLLECFANIHLEVVMGQQLDLIGGQSDTEMTYLLKTSSYTVRGPLELGAVLGRANSRQMAVLGTYARAVGVAFQLRDDLIGTFGRPQHTGKPLGTDLRSGKHTALMALAWQKVRGPERRRLEQVVGNPKATDTEVREAIAILERTGARDAIEGRIDELVEKARRVVARGPIAPSGRALLSGAAEALALRIF